MNRLAILGASGHGKVVADAAERAGWRHIVFFDDAKDAGGAIGPWPIHGRTGDLAGAAREFDGAVVAIGDNRIRLRKHQELSAAGLTLATIVHPSAVVSPHAVLGSGTVVFACAVVNPFTRLGVSCIVNTSASIDHDCLLGDAVHISPGAHLGGGVSVGDGTWIGIGAAVRHGVRVGSSVMVAAGAAVVNDIEDGMTVMGVPAKQR